MKRFKAFYAVTSLFAASSAFAGMAQVEVSCQSASGRTYVKAVVPGDSTEASVQIRVDGKTSNYLNLGAVEIMKMNGLNPAKEFPGYQTAVISTINSPSQKVFSIQTIRADQYDSVHFSLVANPTSFRLKNGEYGSLSGTFTAIVNGLDPRKSGSPMNNSAYLKPVTVSCTYDYSI